MRARPISLRVLVLNDPAAGLDDSNNTFFRQMDELNGFMREKRLPHVLRVKLRNFFRFRRNTRAMVEWSNIMYVMSDTLRSEVAEAGGFFTPPTLNILLLLQAPMSARAFVLNDPPAS